MTTRRRLIWTATVLLVSAAASWRYFRVEIDGTGPERDSGRPAAVAVPPALLAERLGAGTAAPTPQQEAERQAMVERQVGTAAGWLRAGDARKRRDGAEQLSAYPTPAAESLLVAVLQKETDAAVLSAAARSLSYFEHLSPAAFDALLHVLQTGRDGVQNVALSTLLYHAGHEPGDSPGLRRIVEALKALSTDPGLSPALRRAVAGAADELALRVR